MFRIIASIIVVACIIFAWYASPNSDEVQTSNPDTEKNQSIQPAGQPTPAPNNPSGFGSSKFN